MLEQPTSAPLHRLLGHPDTCYVEYNSWQRQFILLTTPPAQALILTHILSSDKIKDEHTRNVGSQELGRTNLWERAPA